jgi:hypothetical protein
LGNDIRNDVERMDRLLEHIEGINDERDSVPILLAVRGLWPLIRAEIVKNPEWHEMWSKPFDKPELL